MTIVTSTLRMQLLDDGFTANAKHVTEALQQAEARVKQIDAALKASGTSERLQANLKKLGASTQHIEGVTRAWGDYVRQEGIAGKATAELTAEQIKGIKTFGSTAVATVRAVIREEKDLTAEARREALERETIMRREAEREKDIRIRAAAAEEAALKRQFEAEVAMRRRHDEQMHHAQSRASFRHYAATGAAAYASAHGVVSGGEKVVEAGADLQHERVQMGNAGISPAEIVRIQDQALKLSAIVGNIGQTQVMEVAKELRSVIADPAELSKVLDPVIRAKSVLDAMDTSGQSSEGISQLVKAGELVGAGQDPARLAKLIDGWVRVMQVSGRTVNPEQIFEFVKYSKTAGAQLSDRFLTTVGPSILQELGGSTTGNDIAQMSKTLNSGFQNRHTALKEMARVGMVDPNAIDYLKNGEAKGLKPGAKDAVRGESLFETDPDKWVYDVLLPHLEAAGMKTTESQLSFVQKAFSGTAADFIAKTITQRQTYDVHAENYSLAKGLAAVGHNAEDATVGVTALSKAIGNLSANVSAPIMAPIGQALTSVAGWINDLAEVAKSHPVGALTAGSVLGAAGLAGSGYLSWKALNGFGLGTAAGELTASAAALDAAAVKLGAAGAVNTVEKAGSEVVKDGKWGLPLLAGAGVPALGAGIILGAGAAAGATNSPMVDDYGRVIGNWGGKDETGNPAYVLPPDAAHAPPIAPYSKDELDRRLQAQKDVRDQALQGQPGAFHPDDLREPTEPPPAKSFWHQIFGATSTGIVPVSFTKDSSSSSMFEEAVARGTYDGFMRVIEAREGDSGGGGGGGGGIVNASYETSGTGDDVGGNTVRRPENLHYNRQHKAILTHRRGADGGGDGDAGAFSARQPGAAGTYRPVYNLSDADLDQRVVNTIAGEVSTKNPEGVDAVVNNMLNRVGSKGWGPSRNLLEVARAKGQYAGYRQASAAETERIRSRIRAIASGGVPDNTHGSNAYRAAYYHGPWYQKHAASSVVIGGNRFAYEGGVRNGPFAPYDKPKEGATYADESRHGMARSAEHPLLPRRPAPVAPHTDDIQAMNVTPAIDHSSIREALHHVRELKREMASLGSASIDVKHHGFGSRGAHSPGAVRTALNGNFTSDGRWA